MKMFSMREDVYPLLSLAFPLALTGLVQSAEWFFETAFLARLGSETLAAGSLVGWLYGTLVVILFGALGSINILVAHKHGEKNEVAIAQVARDGLLLSILLTLPAVILFWNMAPIFLWFGQTEMVVLQAKAYLHALSYGILPNFMIMACFEVIIGVGGTRVILIFSILSVILTVFLSYLLIFGKFGFKALGIAGAGWGLSCSYILTAIIFAVFLVANQKYRYYFRYLFSLKPLVYLHELLQIGIPIGFMYCVEVAFFFVLTLCMGWYGSEVQAANQVALQYLGLCMSVMFAIAQAVTVRMGHLLGARKVKMASNVNMIGLLIAIILMLFPAIFYYFAPEVLIAIDLSIDDMKNAFMINEIKKLFIIAGLFQIFEACRIILFGSLRALKDTRITLLTSILSFWVIALPLGYTLDYFWQMRAQSYWIAMIFGALISILVLSWRFQRRITLFLHRINESDNN